MLLVSGALGGDGGGVKRRRFWAYLGWGEHVEAVLAKKCGPHEDNFGLVEPRVGIGCDRCGGDHEA